MPAAVVDAMTIVVNFVVGRDRHRSGSMDLWESWGNRWEINMRDLYGFMWNCMDFPIRIIEFFFNGFV